MEIDPTLIVVLVIVFYVFSSIQILAEYERGVIFRLGSLPVFTPNRGGTTMPVSGRDGSEK